MDFLSFAEYCIETYCTPVVGFEPTEPESLPCFQDSLLVTNLHTLARIPPPRIELGWPEDTGFTVPPPSIGVYGGEQL